MYTLDRINTQFTSHDQGQIDCSEELEPPIIHYVCLIGKMLPNVNVEVRFIR